MPNTRFKLRAQLIVTCRDIGGLAGSDGGVQRAPPCADRAVRIALRPLRPGWNRLQREQLLSHPRAYRNPVGDRMPDQVIQRAWLCPRGQPGVLAVALEETTAFQHLAHCAAICSMSPSNSFALGAATGRNTGALVPSSIAVRSAIKA